MKYGKLIGKGTFSKVYRDGEADTVTILTNDYAKEAFDWYCPDDDCGLFPQIDYIGYDDQFDCRVYQMKYYPKTRSIKQNVSSRDWELYKALKEVQDSNFYIQNKYDCYQTYYKAFKGLPTKFEREKQCLIEMVDAVNNYGPMGFEISPRNVAIDNGRLILLDCFFLVDQLKEYRS